MKFGGKFCQNFDFAGHSGRFWQIFGQKIFGFWDFGRPGRRSAKIFKIFGDRRPERSCRQNCRFALRRPTRSAFAKKFNFKIFAKGLAAAPVALLGRVLA